MSKSSLNSLYNFLARKISGQASYSENQKFNKWINSSPKAKDTYSDLQRIWAKRYFSEEDLELVSQEEASEKIWQSTFGKNKNPDHRLFNSSFLIKVAALVIIFVTTVFAVFFTTEKEPIVPQITEINKHTLPGQKSTITLRDGTVVWLNSGSKLSYLSNYNDSLRIIELEGQAFFEVFKDSLKPFIVKCRNLEVEALGTSFDVNAYRNIPIQVSLLTGSVRVSVPSSSNPQKELILNPGEFSIVNSDGIYKSKGIFNPYEILAWKEGRLIFKDETIGEIVPKLELWFGVQIYNFSEVDPNRPFNTTFEKENLDNILMNIGTVLEFDYIMEGNKVTITKKNMPM